MDKKKLEKNARKTAFYTIQDNTKYTEWVYKIFEDKNLLKQ